MNYCPTCHHCSHEYRDGWECFTDHVEETVIECPNCQLEYACTIIVDVTYESKPIPAHP